MKCHDCHRGAACVVREYIAEDCFYETSMCMGCLFLFERRAEPGTYQVGALA
jgi:hypothetical protein